MSAGAGVFLAVVGAIFAFAVRDAVPGVDLTLVGYILLVAGLMATLVAVYTARGPRRRTTSSTQVSPTADGGEVVVGETSIR